MAMINNSKFSVDITVSKICAFMIIVIAPFLLTGGLLTSAWMIAAGLLGWKQGADALKAVNNKPKPKDDEDVR